MAFAPVFFRTAKLSTDNAFNFQLGALAAGALGTGIAWLLMAWVGRRTIHLQGLATLFVLLALKGTLAVAAFGSFGVGWGIAALVSSFTLPCTETIVSLYFIPWCTPR